MWFSFCSEYTHGQLKKAFCLGTVEPLFARAYESVCHPPCHVGPCFFDACPPPLTLPLGMHMARDPSGITTHSRDNPARRRMQDSDGDVCGWFCTFYLCSLFPSNSWVNLTRLAYRLYHCSLLFKKVKISSFSPPFPLCPTILILIAATSSFPSPIFAFDIVDPHPS